MGLTSVENLWMASPPSTSFLPRISYSPCQNPKILGLTLDPHFTFGPHVKTVVGKMATRLKVLKALAGTNWGDAKEDLLLTYKALGGSIIDYAAPIFSPNLKPTHVKKLQTMQNHCLRVVTGSHLAASMEHLHHETMTLPVGHGFAPKSPFI